jgi:hypothetical protein
LRRPWEQRRAAAPSIPARSEEIARKFKDKNVYDAFYKGRLERALEELAAKEEEAGGRRFNMPTETNSDAE